MFDFYFYAKILLLLALWTLILSYLTIIVFSRKIYLSLAKLEVSFNDQVKESILSLSPFFNDLSALNLTFQKLIGLKPFSAKDALFLSPPFLTSNSRFIKSIKMAVLIAKRLSVH